MPMHLFLILGDFPKSKKPSAWAKKSEYLEIYGFQKFSDSKRVHEKLHNQLPVFCWSQKSTFFNPYIVCASSRLQNAPKAAQKSDFIVQLL